MLRVLALIFVLLLWATPNAGAQEFEIPSVAISGGGLPSAVTLAPADADAFRRRVNQLPRLEEPPQASGRSFTVTTSYWPLSLRLEDEEDVVDVSVRGEYFPNGGFVRIAIGEDEAWAVLNLRQRAILDRYIRLAEAGAIGDEPSTIAVLAAAVEAGEVLGAQAGPDVLDPAAIEAVLTTIASSGQAIRIDPRVPPVQQDGGFWLIVTLLEGRTLHYYFDGLALTELLGTERYESPAVTEALAAIAPADIPVLIGKEPVGSLLWWPVMAGGGLIALGIAVWLRRRFPTP